MLKLEAKVTVDFIKGFDCPVIFHNDEYTLWETKHGDVLMNKKGDYYLMTKGESAIFISQYDANNKMIQPIG